MSALLDNGLDVTALHNHFFFETPRIFYMHVHGHGTAADLASKIKPALALIGKTRRVAQPQRRACRLTGSSTLRSSRRSSAPKANRTERSTRSPLAVPTSR